MTMNVESLERRTLMSGWTTVDAVSNGGQLNAMAADAAGNLYAVGSDSNDGNLGLVREKPAGSSNWTTIFAPSGVDWRAAALDRSGNLFVAGRGSSNNWMIDERPAPTASNPQPAFQTIDTGASGFSGEGYGLATDAAGNVFAAGRLSTSAPHKDAYYWTVRKGAYSASLGKWGFSTVDQFTLAASSVVGGAVGVTVIDSGSSAGVYVVGGLGGAHNWVVRKSSISSDGNVNTWSQVDDFRDDSTGNALSSAVAVVGSGGNIYIVGSGQKGTITGYTKNKTPIYSYGADHWLVRKSGTGNAGSWSINDDFQLSSDTTDEALAVGADAAGNIYAVGDSFDLNSGDHGIIRSNAGGSWHTLDDDVSDQADWHAFTVDPITGDHYAGGDNVGDGWVIRSDAPVVAAARITPSSSVLATFSSLPIAETQADALLDLTS